jgi:hypothetical protein
MLVPVRDSALQAHNTMSTVNIGMSSINIRCQITNGKIPSQLGLSQNISRELNSLACLSEIMRLKFTTECQM